MTTEYNEAETLLTITDSEKWNGLYKSVPHENDNTACDFCIFNEKNLHDCTDIKCTRKERKDATGCYYVE